MDEKDRRFVPQLIQHFHQVICSEESDLIHSETLYYAQSMLSLLTDLMSQLPTRRFLRVLLEDCYIVVLCRIDPKVRESLAPQLEVLEHFLHFEINDHTGHPIAERQVGELHVAKFQTLQRLCFEEFHEQLSELALIDIATASGVDYLRKTMSPLTTEALKSLCEKTALIPRQFKCPVADAHQFYVELITYTYQYREPLLGKVRKLVTCPTEKELWDVNEIESVTYHAGAILPMMRMNQQFLTMQDYLWRCFTLFRREATVLFRHNIMNAVKQVKARRSGSEKTVFHEKSDLALPIQKFSLVRVARPKIGETKPAYVSAAIECTLDDCISSDGPGQWDTMNKNDAVFLVNLRPIIDETAEMLGHQTSPETSDVSDALFPEQFGIVSVRVAHIESILDTSGKVCADTHMPLGDKRTLNVHLDPAQFREDAAKNMLEDAYEKTSLVIRVKPSHLKTQLDLIRTLIQETAHRSLLPSWLVDIFLGYGDPEVAHYSNMAQSLTKIDFGTTFVDEKHLKESFPAAQFDLTVEKDESSCKNYQLSIDIPSNNEKIKILAQPFAPLCMTPFQTTTPEPPSVRHSKQMIESIVAGIFRGCTIVTGPEERTRESLLGLVSTLHRNFQDERILVVAHSDRVVDSILNQLIIPDATRVVELGVRNSPFTERNRIDAILTRRLELLALVEGLATSLSLKGTGFATTCENAAYFLTQEIQPRIEKFLNDSATDDIASVFPFTRFFAHAPQPLFRKDESDKEQAQVYIRFLHQMFKELESYRAYELLRTPHQRRDYLMIKHARIIVTTSANIILAADRLKELNCQYQSLIMTETEQMMDIETFIPQATTNGLERIAFYAHPALQPIICHASVREFGRLNQSLVARLIRLGMPSTDLDSSSSPVKSVEKKTNSPVKSVRKVKDFSVKSKESPVKSTRKTKAKAKESPVKSKNSPTKSKARTEKKKSSPVKSPVKSTPRKSKNTRSASTSPGTPVRSTRKRGSTIVAEETPSKRSTRGSAEKKRESPVRKSSRKRR